MTITRKLRATDRIVCMHGVPEAACAEAIYRILLWTADRAAGWQRRAWRRVVLMRLKRHLLYFLKYSGLGDRSVQVPEHIGTANPAIDFLVRNSPRLERSISDSQSAARFDTLCSYRASSNRLSQTPTAPPLPTAVSDLYSTLCAVPIDARVLYAVGDKSFASRDPRTDLVRLERLFAVLRVITRGVGGHRRRFCVEEGLGPGDVVYGMPLIKAEPAFQVCCRPDLAWLIEDSGRGRHRCARSLVGKQRLAYKGIRLAAACSRRACHFGDLLRGDGDSFLTTEDFFKLMVLKRWGSWETAAEHFADALATRHQGAARQAGLTPKSHVWLDLGGQPSKRGCVHSVAATVECASLVATRLEAQDQLVVNIRPSRELCGFYKSVSALLQSRMVCNVRLIEEMDVRIIAREMALCRRVICTAATSGLISLFFGYPTSILVHRRSNPKWQSIRAAFESRGGHHCSFNELSGDGDEASVAEALGMMSPDVFDRGRCAGISGVPTIRSASNDEGLR